MMRHWMAALLEGHLTGRDMRVEISALLRMETIRMLRRRPHLMKMIQQGEGLMEASERLMEISQAMINGDVDAVRSIFGDAQVDDLITRVDVQDGKMRVR